MKLVLAFCVLVSAVGAVALAAPGVPVAPAVGAGQWQVNFKGDADVTEELVCERTGPTTIVCAKLEDFLEQLSQIQKEAGEHARKASELRARFDDDKLLKL